MEICISLFYSIAVKIDRLKKLFCEMINMLNNKELCVKKLLMISKKYTLCIDAKKNAR